MHSHSTVLVVDDSAISRRVAVAILEKAGYGVETAEDGQTGLAMAAQDAPHLILLDVRMPDMDGFEVCRRLKASELTRHIPVIFLTGENDVEAEINAYAVGGADFIAKPLKAHALLARAKVHIAMYQQRRSLEGNFRDVIEFSPVAFLIADPSLHIVQVNALAMQLFDLPRKAMQGKPLEELIAQGPHHVHAYTPGDTLDPPDMPHGIVELNCRRGDGAVFTADVTFGHLKTVNGGLFVIVVQDNTDRKRMLADIQESRQTLRDYAIKIELAREDERKSIAREVHDEFGQVLTGLRMELSLVRMQFGNRFEDLDAKIESMSSLTDRAINEVRSIATHLRPTAMDMGLVPSIEWLRDEFVRQTQVPCVLSIADRDLTLDEARSMVMYRILQESLTNITKYAKAKRVEILLKSDGLHVSMLISDDGCGFHVESRGSKKTFGILGMQERAMSLNGSLKITSEVGVGTQVYLRIPTGLQSVESSS